MSRPAEPFPSAEEGLRLHRRLCAADPVATADVCAAYITPLLNCLARRFPRVDPHLREGAAHEALLAYAQHPESYDERRSDLAAYLRMAAHADLLNLLAREKRHHSRHVPLSSVEVDGDAGNLPGREEEPVLRLQRQEEEAARQEVIRSVREGLTPGGQRVLDLMLAGERRTAPYAEALGLGDRPADEQEREVKRAKDRIKKRLERGGGRHG